MTITSRKTTIDNKLRTDAQFSQPFNERLKDLLTEGLVVDAPTPVEKTGDATLTIDELITGIITATKATAVAFTLPTGALTDAGILGGALAVDQAIAWTVINLGSSSGAVTLGVGDTHTIVGNAVVAISTSAQFLTRKTAANTFVTYRIA